MFLKEKEVQNPQTFFFIAFRAKIIRTKYITQEYNIYVYSNFMQDECLNSKYVYEEALPVSRLVTATAESMYDFHLYIMYSHDANFKRDEMIVHSYKL